MVSRVSPPARSIGLLRLHRGGTRSLTADSRADGSGMRTRSRSTGVAFARIEPPPDPGRWTVGVEAEVVGHGAGGGVPGRPRPTDAHAGRTRPVHEARNEVAGLAGHTDAAGGRVRPHELGAQLGWRGYDALTVGPGE